LAILKNVAVYFCKLKKPSAKFDKENPKWELQIRTSDLAKKAELEALGLKPKLMMDSSDEPILDENNKKQYRVNLQKGSIKKDGTPSKPIEVIDGRHNPIDPTSIGNGSIVNIILYQREFKDAAGKDKISNTPTKIQVIKHILYVAPPFEDFGEEETETILPDTEGDGDDSRF
jgi:hypothetical protein